MTVYYGVPFEMSWNCRVPSEGTVVIDFDTNCFELQSSSILGNDIIWKLNPILSNQVTKISITERGGIAPYIRGQTWDVYVDMPPISPPNSPAPSEEGFPSFIASVSKGFAKIKAKYPDAQLYYAELTAPTWGPFGFPVLAITALVTINSVTKQAIIATKPSLLPTEFGKIILSDAPIMGNLPITWPITMDMVEALTLLAKAGYGNDVTDTMLRRPLTPGFSHEPWYIFTLQDKKEVGVGVDDKTVRVFGTETTTTAVPTTKPSQAVKAPTKLANGLFRSTTPQVAAH